MSEPDELFAMWLPAEFPLSELKVIRRNLIRDGGLVPGYVPSSAGMLNLAALFYSERVERLETIILPDRNLVSRMAAFARGPVGRPFDLPTRMAANLMAFAQCMGLDIEPSVAYHELAHQRGNEVAQEELAWFRAADQAQAQAWVDIAVGKRVQLDCARANDIPYVDLAYPLGRWQRNYVATLKIAELEVTEISPVSRALVLLEWMMTDFFLAGPAALFALMYFSPRAQRRRLLKQVRSLDRERAIEGARNAAWDITHLSDFSARAKRCESERRRYIFASADKGLSAIASVLLIDAEEAELVEAFERMLVKWWPLEDARLLASKFTGSIRLAAMRPAPSSPGADGNPIPKWIRDGEARMRAWSPSAISLSPG